MRARDSRLADRLMFVVSVTTNLSQRIAGRLVQLPAPVTFILSQLGLPALSCRGLPGGTLPVECRRARRRRREEPMMETRVWAARSTVVMLQAIIWIMCSLIPVASQGATTLRPPSVPLVACDPYFS